MASCVKRIKKTVEEFERLLAEVGKFAQSVEPDVSLEEIRKNINAEIVASRKASRNKKKAERRAKRNK